ncbi:tetratricopeptide repeat protein [Lacibacterium aquatile]|uniref:Tetratricopeptide repeat protein n=1 Tax=Lacibacterium aquatile TaxID=1168082 RepID=A0ABW5DW63_9PROT
MSAELAQRLKKAFDDYAAGQLDVVYSECRSLIRADKRLSGAHYLLGLVLIEKDEPRKAIESLKQALAVGADNPALRMALGRAYRMGGAIAMAITEYENAVRLAPGYGEALHALGTAHLDAGNMSDALLVLGELAELDPENPGVLSALGVALRQAGRAEAAARIFEKATVLAPDRASLWSNAGVALMESGEPEKALPYLQKAVELEPAAVQYRRNLALGLTAAGRGSEAADILDGLLDEQPEDPQLVLDLAAAMVKAGEDPVELLQEAVEVIDDDTRLWYALGEALRAAGKFDDAIDAYDRCLELDPDDKHGATLALALSGADPAPPAPPEAYVAQLFDDYAGRFDTELTKYLDYKGPALLAKLAQTVAPDRKFDSAYDIGCGTGLAAPFFRPLAHRLIGVDLSPKMVEQARARGQYDALAVDEAVAWMQAQGPRGADLIFAADVLVYLGDLGPFLAAAMRSLRPGGLLLFTTEATQDPAVPYELHQGHRYAHGGDALRASLQAASFQKITVDAASTRTNRGQPVPGWIVSAWTAAPIAPSFKERRV